MSAFVVSGVAALVTVAVVAAILGCDLYAVRSDSMKPALSTGDIVVTSPPQDGLGPNTVVVFGEGRETMVHRIVKTRSDGTYTTRGDANPHPDSSPLAPSDVRGIGRLVVPFIGLPLIWWDEGRVELVLACLAALVLLLFGSRYIRLEYAW